MRTYLITGAASGIGAATAELLIERGDRVIGADLRGTDIDSDLTTPEGREHLVAEATRLSGGALDGIIAVAGLATPTPATVGVNYFGMIASLEGLRPLLAGSDAPRAVGVGSMASLMPGDDRLVELLLADDEPGALARAAELAASPEQGPLIYSSTKIAFARWVRRHAADAEWAGAGIPLNAVAPGIILTPMVAPLMETEEGRAQMAQAVPMPLNGPAEAVVVARLLAWLAGPENTHLCGQVVFVDGGSDVVIRGDATW
ncbi:SDR family oxidoreductase [Microbacterium sp. No. 7]|uniref:SDR family oxidoreductase n=1 Tax=Microbacterium sp. No. 7 TaxID=1714373 RepID=UPI0006CF5F6D|nr:short-chain dehydrogenase [Microbacterium sp. No. 7]